MDDVVIDSNVAVKWVIREADSQVAWQLNRETRASGGRLLLLDFGLVEAAHVIWTQFHRKMITRVEADHAFTELRVLPITLIQGETLLATAFDLACQFKVAVYDALFVAAVKELNCRGVTADERLVTAVETAFPQILRLKDWK